MSVPGTYAKARPIGDIDVIWEEDIENVLVHSDGRVTRAMLGIIPDDQFPLLKQGYGCAACFMRLDVAFPENCPTCNFPMRERQTAYMAEELRREREDGPLDDARGREADHAGDA